MIFAELYRRDVSVEERVPNGAPFCSKPFNLISFDFIEKTRAEERVSKSRSLQLIRRKKQTLK